MPRFWLDGKAEYNAAAFVSPRNGLLGLYRKRPPEPCTEYVPWHLPPAVSLRYLEGGSSDRMDTVVPLICLDDVDTGLTLTGTRLGAQILDPGTPGSPAPAFAGSGGVSPSETAFPGHQ